MAKREVKPHGTFARWRKHDRDGDAPCDPCRVAYLEYRRNWRNGIKGTDGEPVVLTNRVEVPDELPDELTEVRANYDAVVAAMSSPATPATALASLSARREALYERVLHLSEQRQLKDLVASITNGPDAAEAVRAAGGSALDALLARAQADQRPVKRRGERVDLDPALDPDVQ